MKRAELSGVVSTFEVGAEYREVAEAMTRDQLVDALVQEAELRGAWQQLAGMLARRAPDAGVVSEEAHVWGPERLAAARDLVALYHGDRFPS
jgi:hypothetical protein